MIPAVAMIIIVALVLLTLIAIGSRDKLRK